jgi:hypothetical protein
MMLCGTLSYACIALPCYCSGAEVLYVGVVSCVAFFVHPLLGLHVMHRADCSTQAGVGAPRVAVGACVPHMLLGCCLGIFYRQLQQQVLSQLRMR